MGKKTGKRTLQVNDKINIIPKFFASPKILYNFLEHKDFCRVLKEEKKEKIIERIETEFKTFSDNYRFDNNGIGNFMNKITSSTDNNILLYSPSEGKDSKIYKVTNNYITKLKDEFGVIEEIKFAKIRKNDKSKRLACVWYKQKVNGKIENTYQFMIHVIKLDDFH